MSKEYIISQELHSCRQDIWDK